MAAWKDKILSGVDSVKYHGFVPGYIIVYGDNSDAILTNETGETLIAAGELGQGRVVVFSHDTFIKGYLQPALPKENESLLLNVKAWVTRGTGTVAVNVDGTNSFDQIPANGFLVWSGKKKDDTFLKKMADWIQNGGGLVCGTCPWGYAQVTGIAIENMPLNFIMSKLGMSYATCDDYFSTRNELSVDVNCAEIARLDKAVAWMMAGGDMRKVRKTLRNIPSVLHELWQQRLKAEKIASLGEKCTTTTAARNWRDEILGGVESVKYQGCVPGYIIVYGDNSDAILTNETGETLIAAGELGKGRVVVFSHDTFIKGYLKPELPKENETLLLNVKAWVTRGTGTVAVNVDGTNSFDEIPANGFLVWSGKKKDDTFLNKMADWIRNGGGLVCGTCPWGYAQVTGIAIENIPLNFIMRKLGMNYATCDGSFSTRNELSVNVNCAEIARLDKAVDWMMAGGDMRKVRKTLGNIPSILHEVWCNIRTAARNWRDEILSGVDSVKYHGLVPGYIIVYGENSDAILTNETGETLIATGELGQGRVVVFSHDTFIKGYLQPELPKENEALLLNVKAWVTRGKDTVAVNVDGTNSFDEIPANGFLVWSGKKKDDTFLNKMADWIRNGGGLVCGTCPWGYAQVTGIAIENMPLNFIMGKLGMNYATCDGSFSTRNELSVDVNCAEIARLDKAVDWMMAGGDMRKVRKTLGNITSIPREVYQQIVKPAIESLKQQCHFIPTKDKKVVSTKEKLVATMLCNLMIKDGLAGDPVVAEGRKEFPGDFDGPPRLEVTTIESIGKEHQYVPTGCYLPAGKEMSLSWEKDGARGWSVVIGAHTDELFHVEDAWRRWPKVSIKRTLENSPLKICSPFGGLVYMMSPKAPSHLKVTLRNIVPAPRFTFKTAGSWDSERRKPGLWTDISGDLITFTMLSKSIRQLNDPCPTMRLWDEVVRAHMELRGCDPSRGRGQWVVTDEQPSLGYMHNGYPIVTHLDVGDPTHKNGDHFLMNGDGIVNPRGNGFWGLFHELGHNYQHDSWTWAGAGEVTVNIFSLHAMDTLCKMKPWIHPWLADYMSDVKAYLQGGADFEKWKSDPGVALAVYAQQARDFGWKPFKAVFREYEALPSTEQPKNDEDKIRQWIVRFSKATGRNLCPAFEFWGFPCTDEANGFLGDLPPYLPADETTLKMAPDRAREISVKYNVNI